MFKRYKEELEKQRNTPDSNQPSKQPDKSNGNQAQQPESPRKLRRQKTGSKEEKDWEPLKRHKSMWNKDVMISYSHANKNFMTKFKDGLEANGISVWVDVTGLKAGVDFLSKIGEAIIDAKCFVSLLSEESIKSKYCQDELALAYVSSKPIFPVGLDTPEVLFPKMDTGMKLQLARFKWHVFTEENFDDKIQELVAMMKEKINPVVEAKDTAGQEAEHDSNKDSSKAQAKKHKRQVFNKQSMKKSMIYDRLESTSDNLTEERMLHFWQRNFSEKESVPWTEFERALGVDYGDTMKLIYSAQDKDWLMGILRRELEVDNKETGSVQKDIYIDFCTVDGELLPFWLRVQDQAVESYTMKEVFSMDSSVRIEAIENLGKFRSTAVIEALLDLLKDPDTNVRAVAAISLARTGDDSDGIINALMKSLKDKDRLVRESGCLALGHLKATKAVNDILHLWRNDFISHVREAAQVALTQIGGEEAEKAIHMTKVLSDEIRFLTNE